MPRRNNSNNFHEKFSEEMAYTFDDVTLVPRYSDIMSRSSGEIDISINIAKSFRRVDHYRLEDWDLDIPIISTCMPDITDLSMAIKMRKLGGLGAVHRFGEYEDYEKVMNDYVWAAGDEIKNENRDFYNIGFAVGSILTDDEKRYSREKDRIDCYWGNGVKLFFVDIAHGDSKHGIETIKYIKSLENDFGVEGRERNIVVSGSVANRDCVQRLVDAGVDMIRVGVGDGSLCTTRLVTGHGVPQLTAIQWIREELDKIDNEKVLIISDGGIKETGDIVKAFAAGADLVMSGWLFAGSIDTPAEIVEKDGMSYKKYRGMASLDAYKMRDTKNVTPEGVSTLVPLKSGIDRILPRISAGICSGLSYTGARNIKELRELSRFIRITGNGFIEGTPHGLMRGGR